MPTELKFFLHKINYAFSGGGIMIKLTDGARKELDAFFTDKEKSTVRVFLAPGG